MKPITLKTIVESNETTHFSVMDNKGRAVSLTVTLNGSYGSGVVSNRFGIALNNEMDDFTTKPGQPNLYGLIQGMGNTVEPGKRPLSSMSPYLGRKGWQDRDGYRCSRWAKNH
jgi:gamma-glutamyltranspeptidase/glutathione hydrolase